MIVKQGGMVFVKFPEHFCYNSLTHEFRFVSHPEMPAVLINGLDFVVVEFQSGLVNPFQIDVFAISGIHGISL
jgi:hypothetical protein